MGTVISRVRIALGTIRAISAAYEELSQRISVSPGIPIPNPCTPYWTIPPSPISSYGSDENLPDYADVVVIGSGITGTSFVRTLLDEDLKANRNGPPLKVVMLEARDTCSGATARNGGHITPPLYHDYSDLKKSVGASAAKSIIRFRLAHLAEMLRIAVEEGLLQDSQCREVQTFDVFFEKEMFELSKVKLKAYLDDIPEETEKWTILEGEESLKGLQVSAKVAGAISTRAGAVHPYRFVTGILSRLLNSETQTFQLFAHTPCTSISSHSKGPGEVPVYTLTTPRGDIHTQHVVHATNAWASHLLPPLRKKIIPVRGNMSAQRPGLGLGKILEAGSVPPPGQDIRDDPRDNKSWLGTRSFVFFSGTTEDRWDYLTQLPVDPPASQRSTSSFPLHYPPSSGEFMFGGGLIQGGFAERAFFEEVGNVDDSGWNMGVSAYLSGALGVYFGNSWGEEGGDSGSAVAKTIGDNFAEAGGADIMRGRVKKLWGGIIGISADSMPWVGRLPAKVSGRETPTIEAVDPSDSWVVIDDGRYDEFIDGNISDDASPTMDTSPMLSKAAQRLVTPGEWISAGYSGEGMVHAWLSGKALAFMVLGKDEDGVGSCGDTGIAYTDQGLQDWFPDVFRVTEKRWKKANIDDFF